MLLFGVGSHEAQKRGHQGGAQVRREVPGRPVIYATTPDFLQHFGLESRRDLPGIDDLKAAGLLDPLDEEALQLALDGEDELETEAEED